MQTPEPLQVLQPDSPVPRKRPVPLQVLQRPEPPQGEQTELPEAVPPSELTPPVLTQPDNNKRTDKLTRVDRMNATSMVGRGHYSMLLCAYAR